MTRHELKAAAIAIVAAWIRHHKLAGDPDAVKAARQSFDHLPASVIVSAAMLADDDADSAIWSRMESIFSDTEALTSRLDRRATDRLDSEIPF